MATEEELLQAIHRVLEGGDVAELCVVAGTHGSSPRKAGALLAVLPGAKTVGTVGGGSLERLVIRDAEQLRRGKLSACRTYTIDGPASDTGMVCGGDVTVCMVAIEPAWADHVGGLLARLRQGIRACLVFEGLNAGELRLTALTLEDDDEPLQSRLSVTAEEQREMDELSARAPRGTFAFFLSSEALTRQMCLDALALDDPIENDDMLVVPLGAQGRAIVFGAGHVGAALVPVLAGLGLPVVVCDDREALARPELHPAAVQVICAPYSQAVQDVHIGSRDQVAVCTASHASDVQVVTAALSLHPRYLGCLGSKKKTAFMHGKLAEAGFSAEDIARLHMPVGLKIGAETPREIAISVAAELVACRRGVSIS